MINVILEWEGMRRTILSVNGVNKFKIQTSAHLKLALYPLGGHAHSLTLNNAILNFTSLLPPAFSSSATYPGLCNFLLPPFPLLLS